MDDFCDLTPPSSPETTKKYDVKSVPDISPVFSCKGTVNPASLNNLNSDGYLVSGSFRKLLTGWKQPDDEDCCEIFGMTFVTSSLIYNSESVFSSAKKCIVSLYSAALRSNSTSAQDSKSSFYQRKQLFNFLCYIKYSLLRHSKSHCRTAFSINVNKVLEDFLNQWKGLLLFVGRLSDLPDHIVQNGVSRNGNSSLLSSYHLFHLYLDIWWSTIEIIHIIDVIQCEQAITVEVIYSRPLVPGFDELFSQLVLVLLWDICYLSAKKYNQIQISDCFSVTPFTCTCIFEIWMMIAHLIEFRQSWKKECLSTYIRYIFQNILSPDPCLVEENVEQLQLDTFHLKPDSFKCINPVEFCIWMLMHLSTLCRYDYYGNYVTSAKVCNNYSGMQKLINLALTAQLEQRNEARLRFILRCCYMLAEVWNSSSDLILPCIEFFLKKLDDSFHQKGLGLEGLPMMCKSGESWVEEIKRQISPSQYVKSTDTSFHTFLKLLSLTLQKSQIEGTGLWKQIRGRIYSKFHPRRIKDLSEMGFYNCLTVFIVLALSNELEDVASKVCDLADMINKGNIGMKKQIISWKSLFALITIYQDNKKDASIIMKTVASYFHQICVAYGKNDNQRQLLMPLIMTYLNGVQNVIEGCSDLTSNEYSLIENGFGMLLSKCVESEAGPFLTTVECILKKIHHLQSNQLANRTCAKSPSTQEHLKYIHTLRDQVLPFLRIHVTTTTALPQSATICSILTQLSAEMGSSFTKSLFTELFNYYGTNRNVNANITCEYLCLLFQDTQLTNSLSKEHYNAALRSWFRCGLCILPPSDKMQKLTQLIFQFPHFPSCIALLKKQSGFLNHDDIMINFFCNVAKGLQSLEETLQTKNDLHYFLQDFVMSLPGLLKNNISKEMIFYIYNLNAHLIEHCSQFLYVKSNSDCLLVTLINELILPRALYAKDKEVPILLLNAIERHMASFLCGITKINFLNDHYLQRKLKELIVQYLPCFEIKRPNSLNFAHPLLNAFLRLPLAATEFFIFAVETIRDNIIKKGFNISSHFILGITFINELFCRLSLANKKIVFPKMLPLLLEQLLVTDDYIAYQKLLESILSMLKLCEKEFDSDFRASFLLPSLHLFLENHMAWKTNRVFKLVQEITTSYPELLADLIPIVSKQVQVIEEKRGVGLDQSLRHGLTALLKQLNGKSSENLNPD